MSLLYRGKYHMEFWVMGLIFQIVYFVFKLSKTAPEVCVDPLWKILLYLVVSWAVAVVLGGAELFGYNIDAGTNKRNERRVFGVKCYYFNVFVSALFIFLYIRLYWLECTH